MKRLAIVIIMLSIGSMSFSQKHEQRFEFVYGGMLSSDEGDFDGSTAANALLISPVIGCRVPVGKKGKYSVEYKYCINHEFQRELGIISTRSEHSIDLLYHRKKSVFGIGHFWKSKDSYYNAVWLFIDRTHRGVEFVYQIPFQNMDIVFRQRAVYSDGFAIRGRAHQNISFVRRWGGEQAQNARKGKINFLLGGRLFTPKDIALQFGDRKPNIAGALQVGFEFNFNEKSTITFDRDWWIGVTPASPFGAIKGKISTTTLRYRRRIPLFDSRTRISAGLATVADADLSTQLHYLEKPHDLKFYSYQIFGASVGASFEIRKNVDLDIRYVVPVFGVKKPDHLRLLSIGSSFRI